MGEKDMRKTVLVQAIACALLSSAAQAAVKVEDKTFNTAANMLAYTEFGALRRAAGRGHSVWIWMCWTPTAPTEPTPFGFAAGIRSYEYSKRQC